MISLALRKATRKEHDNAIAQGGNLTRNVSFPATDTIAKEAGITGAEVKEFDKASKGKELPEHTKKMADGGVTDPNVPGLPGVPELPGVPRKEIGKYSEGGLADILKHYVME